MCGIAAIFAYASSAPGVNEGELVAIRDHMAARGPDGAGLWLNPARRVGFGHRRLSIIDVSSAGAQPMSLSGRPDGARPAGDDGTQDRYWITFNGEIYNYRELRAGLEQKGRRFRSACDTEVLLHLYAEEGEAMLEKLRGMFAFAIWDAQKQTLFLARDPFGIKPLYWADDGQTFRAASQVKALLAGGHIDTAPEPAGHVGFFLWGHVPSPYTLYRGIRAVPAGHSLTLDAQGRPRLRSFCSIPALLAQGEGGGSKLEAGRSKLGSEDGLPSDHSPHRSDGVGGPSSTLYPHSALLASALRDSIRHHLIADVPVGVFLSSGLDSSTLAALASECGSQLRTVTLGFEEYKGTPSDETPLAEAIARHYGARHQTIWVTRQDFEHDLHRLFHAMDQPSTDGVNSYFISRAAAQAGLKVALSGLGGDELFGGYPGFQEIPRAVASLQAFAHCRPFGRGFRVLSAPLLRHLTSPKYAGLLEYGGTYGGAYLLRRGMFMPWELPGILDPDLVRAGWNELQTLARLDATAAGLRSPHLKISALEMTWYMRNQLLCDADWASMAHSLEVRVPLVDVDLLRATAPLFARAPRPTKLDLARTPHTALPADVLNRPKTGFTVPVRSWLQQAFDPTPGAERGLRGWTREVYSVFANNLANHRAALHRRKPLGPAVLPVAAPAGTIEVLVLLTDGFGGFGGISKFNRDFLAAVCAHERVSQVVALPRLMPHDPGALPSKLRYDTSGLGGKKIYSRAVLQCARQLRARSRTGAPPLIICGHINLLPIAWLARRLCGGRLHLIIHGVDAWSPTPSRLANVCARRVNGFIAVSQLTKRRFMRWTGLRDDQGVVLPNCVDLSAYGPGPKSAALLDRYQLRGKRVLLTLGRLAADERYKGFDEVLEVMPFLLAEIPALCYVICGDGSDRPRLAAKARRLGLEVAEAAAVPTSDLRPPTSSRVVGSPVFSSQTSDVSSPVVSSPVVSPRAHVLFTGRVTDAEKADHLRLADVYVMPSSGEGFGIVFLEALACGIPVIGSKVDGSREALLNGRLGALVDPRNPKELRDTILRLLPPTAVGRVPPPGVPISDLRSPISAPVAPPGPDDTVETFSAARFQQRVHAILDCIVG